MIKERKAKKYYWFKMTKLPIKLIMKMVINEGSNK